MAAVQEETEKTHGQSSIRRIVWRYVILMVALHVGALYGIYLGVTAKRTTLIWTSILFWLSHIGITAGAHRLWSHRSYKAKLPLRICLAIVQSLAFQNNVIEWSRNHRVHHKFSETNADPHNAKRGFFFSHIGWILQRYHPDVISEKKQINMSDLLNDPVLMMQRKYYHFSVLLFCFVIPTLVPVYLFGESLLVSYFVCVVARYCVQFNTTWLVNSAAHMWGGKPYDASIDPAENHVVAFLAFGEGFHNYHHTFPQDYSTSEFGWFLNLTTLFIDLCALIGQAYDRKSMPKYLIHQRKDKTGEKQQKIILKLK